MTMTAHPAGYRYRLLPEVKIRREAFGGILYKYGCADRGALSFINSRSLVELLLIAREQFAGDLSTAIEERVSSAASKARLYTALDELVRRGYVAIEAVTTTTAE
ncbi:mycofactocin biosynthesis chaperone MftB [Thermogemmatispora sp.]|uniref:mycofactocin biosynthesis chaperone MftB n=1 Tax=Thermogemmatispora sp. TaxID=1968838 RepID=UPI001D662C0F|nr:mycofactocin biosynthesis chaperone MftB [Thermogemmatispora sp.]MBX5449034.1 mycofactocin biosynthesis chaperone MftB [Thermogemmatispora sp.]